VSTVLSGRSAASSRVPGPPPRTSMAATAGLSNSTAVTPEAGRASSALPTLTPAMSVRRFFKAMVRLREAADGEGLTVTSRSNVKLDVVPANAGTHTAEYLVGQIWTTIFATPGPVVMGP